MKTSSNYALIASFLRFSFICLSVSLHFGCGQMFPINPEPRPIDPECSKMGKNLPKYEALGLTSSTNERYIAQEATIWIQELIDPNLTYEIIPINNHNGSQSGSGLDVKFFYENIPFCQSRTAIFYVENALHATYLPSKDLHLPAPKTTKWSWVDSGEVILNGEETIPDDIEILREKNILN